MAREPIAVIPAAGVGTRLRPHTHTQPKVLLHVAGKPMRRRTLGWVWVWGLSHTQPKVLLHVAGKPMLGHILDQLPALGVQKIVLIVGYMGERVVDYVRAAYPALEVETVEQPERL